MTHWISGRNTKLQALSFACLTVILTACGGGGGGGDSAAMVAVVPPVSLNLGCIGASCNSTAGNLVNSSGATVWTYDNPATTAASLDINMTGISAGKVVTVIYSNGTASAASLPDKGVSPDLLGTSVSLALDSAASGMVQSSKQDHDDEKHHQLLENNRAIAKKLIPTDSGMSNAGAVRPDLLSVPAQAFYASTALNTTKTWIEYQGTGTTRTDYLTTAQAICTLPNGRNVVVWVDPVAQSLGKAASADIAAFASMYCGPQGGYGQIATLLGDAWGAAAALKYTNVISDSPLQDINIVVVNAPSTVLWAGYFYGGNNILKTATAPNTNEALVFFISADQLKNSLPFTLSTLLHETTHMVNFYQRGVLKGNIHDVWLEETSAMMTEDIVGPTVIQANGSSYNKIIANRLPGYLKTGGAVSYVNWTNLAGSSYYIGGAFGAFLNRRYGVTLYKQLVTSCTDGITNSTSYGCLDTLIKNNGGVGYADEFARFGTSIFGALPTVGAPAGYGYPALTSGGYSLLPIDVSAMVSLLPVPAAQAGTFAATSHTYSRDTVAAGASTYSRRGIVVPPNTTVSVVVK